METTILKTDLHCNKCVDKIEPHLKGISAVNNYKFQLDHPDKLVIIEGDNINVGSVISIFKNEGYTASPYKKEQLFQFPEVKAVKNSFWKNKNTWKRATFNTLNCLIGCSIGDFGMLIFLQAYFPNTSMLWQMILAIIAGLITSIALESTILKIRENFNWSLALTTAFSMSFISMIGMELAMNATDFIITGGKAAFNTYSYWLAFAPALIAGFILPLPYNYYKLEKHGKACH
ncbi:MAG: DUF4396 domain-containing protein [Bacteroidales bacterium]|nr:DUF4396 domain-containing protein [Bacteroidales bacterium]